MEDGEVALLTPLGIELYDKSGKRQQRSPSLQKGIDYVADKRDFRHFMLKEIHEQPETAELWIARHLPHGLPVIADGLDYFAYAYQMAQNGNFPKDWALSNNGWSSFLSLFFSIINANTFI